MKKILPILIVLSIVLSGVSAFAADASLHNEVISDHVDLAQDELYDLAEDLQYNTEDTNFWYLEGLEFADADDPMFLGSEGVEIVDRTEDSVTYEISIPYGNSDDTIESDASLIQPAYIEAIYLMNVRVAGTGSGRNGSISYEIWRKPGEPSPPNTNLTFTMKHGDTATTTKYNGATWSTRTIPDKMYSKTIVTSTDGYTQFWSLNVKGTIDGRSYDFNTSKVLFNKAGKRYPDVVDDIFGKITNKVPTSAMWPSVPEKDRVKELTQKQKDEYKAWYHNKYNKNGPAINWNKIQIHHIKPRKYGGTNANSNLMPVNSTTHGTINAFWNGYDSVGL